MEQMGYQPEVTERAILGLQAQKQLRVLSRTRWSKQPQLCWSHPGLSLGQPSKATADNPVAEPIDWDSLVETATETDLVG